MQPYTALAVGYDVVMQHVAYDLWAEYAHDVLLRHHARPQSVLELGCGTGSLALELQPLGPYTYLATDGSSYMIQVARRKEALAEAAVRFEVADFTDFRLSDPVDAIVLLYDGLNYVLEEADLRDLFRCAYAALKPHGVFLFDQSTPANSVNNEAYFEDEGEQDGFSFARRSSYDPERHLHTTTFDLTIAGTDYREQHVQRAYALREIRTLVQDTRFEEVAAYDGFTTEPATEASERVHWMLKKRDT